MRECPYTADNAMNTDTWLKTAQNPSKEGTDTTRMNRSSMTINIQKQLGASPPPLCHILQRLAPLLQQLSRIPR
jgi:hypothetical protein